MRASEPHQLEQLLLNILLNQVKQCRIFLKKSDMERVPPGIAYRMYIEVDQKDCQDVLETTIDDIIQEM